jgi:hypothetical protein
MAQQRLIDARKNQSEDISSEEMLENLRNEVRKNRELCQDRLGKYKGILKELILMKKSGNCK